MYPGEGMYADDQPVHCHHLSKMDDDDADDGNDDNDHHRHHEHDHDHCHCHDHNPYPGSQHHNHPPCNTPPPSRHHPTPPKRTHTPTATPPLRPQQPLQPPTPLNPPQQLQPPTPTPLHPPVPLQPPTPLPPQPPLQFQPTPQLQQRPPPDSPPTPRKPHPPPPMDLNHPHHYNDGDDVDDEDKNPQRQLGAIVFILLLLFGLTALILWLVYRPTKPQFTAVATLIYSLNTTTSTAATIAPATVATSMQFVIHTRNPNKRTTLTYDHLAATVYYRTTAITLPVSVPPLYHRKKSSVIIAPLIGGPPAVPVPVAAEMAEEIAANEAYGVIGFSWVVVGRVRYRVGGFKSGHSRVYVRCDVVVRLNCVNNGVYINPGGQVPLLASPPCLVDI